MHQNPKPVVQAIHVDAGRNGIRSEPIRLMRRKQNYRWQTVHDLLVRRRSKNLSRQTLRREKHHYHHRKTIRKNGRHLRKQAHLRWNGYRVYRYKGEAKILMANYIKESLEAFPEDCSKSVKTPAASYLFEINDECAKISETDRKVLHSIVAKLLFVTKRARPDISVPIAFLTSRVTKAD